jgi:hypothetical protein
MGINYWPSFWLGVIHAVVTVIVGVACFCWGAYEGCKKVYRDLHIGGVKDGNR